MHCKTIFTYICTIDNKLSYLNRYNVYILNHKNICVHTAITIRGLYGMYLPNNFLMFCSCVHKYCAVIMFVDQFSLKFNVAC